MGSVSVRAYFEDEGAQRNALKAVQANGWLDPVDILAVYDLSWRAFDPAASHADAYVHFKRIYDRLAGSDWQVFRAFGSSECWSAEKVFRTLCCEFGEFSWRDGLRLDNFGRAGR